MKSININFYSGRAWIEKELTRKYPPSNHAWNLGLMDDVANDRYIVLDETIIYMKEKAHGIGGCFLGEKMSKTTFAWSDTERVYDRESNLDFQFRWTTVAGKNE